MTGCVTLVAYLCKIAMERVQSSSVFLLHENEPLNILPVLVHDLLEHTSMFGDELLQFFVLPLQLPIRRRRMLSVASPFLALVGLLDQTVLLLNIMQNCRLRPMCTDVVQFGKIVAVLKQTSRRDVPLLLLL